jgi:hypothetical protein
VWVDSCADSGRKNEYNTGTNKVEAAYAVGAGVGGKRLDFCFFARGFNEQQ